MSIPLSKSIERVINRNFNNISNLNLLMTKYVRGWKDNWEFGSKEKGEYLESLINVNYDRLTYTKFLERWKLLLNSIEAVQMKGKVLWRLVVGLGSGSVLETSMTLHHIFGVPYISGTALKGVVSSYYLEKYREELFKNLENMSEDEKNKYINKKGGYDLELDKDENYAKLFGIEGQRGKVIFLDAYPVKFPQLEIDIMNPHFGDYYDGKTPPADWLTPVPVKFVTVAKDTEFIFAFKTECGDLKELVKTLIKEALEDLGIGAKTSVGYGYFKDLEDCKVEELPQIASNTSPASVSENPKQPLANYLKNENELKDEYLKPDGIMKSEEEYKNFLKVKDLSKNQKQQYEKAKKWHEKNKGAK